MNAPPNIPTAGGTFLTMKARFAFTLETIGAWLRAGVDRSTRVRRMGRIACARQEL